MNPELLIGIAALGLSAVLGFLGKLLWGWVAAGFRTKILISLADAVKDAIKPEIDLVKDQISDIKRDIHYIKNNGIEEKRRMSNAEDRIQQGAVELDELRQDFKSHLKRRKRSLPQEK